MKLISAVVLGCIAACSSQHSTAFVEIKPGNVEVVVSPNAKSDLQVAWFAAQEMTNFLSRAFACAVPLATTPTPSKVSIVVGTNNGAKLPG